ncbi:MAG: hypothetical protein ACTSRZ_08135 [Promethearchaeota archaeon]
MFDKNKFNFDNDINKNFEQSPPPSSSGFPPGPHLPPHLPPPPPPPPFPFDPETFRELKTFFLFLILSNNLEGITTYQLEKSYGFPRTSSIRLLKKLIDNNYVVETTPPNADRKQKYYKLTGEGIKYFKNLKEKWVKRLIKLLEFPQINLEHSKGDIKLNVQQLIDNLNIYSDRTDIEDYLRSIRLKLKTEISLIEQQLGKLKDTKSKLDDVIIKIGSATELNDEKIQDILKSLLQ